MRDFQCGMQICLNIRILVAEYIRLHARIYPNLETNKKVFMYDNRAYVTLRPFAYIFLQLGKMGQKHEVNQRTT